MWSDESCFSTAGIPNRKNIHYWSTDNPEKFFEVKHSGRRSVNVWCGIKDFRILGPIFFNQSLTGIRYLDMLQNDIEDLFDDLPLNEVQGIVFQQDGAPAHNVAEVTTLLNGKYETWIGKHGTITWPPNSPDLTPLDTFLWGYLKNNIYLKEHDNVDLLKAQIRNQIDTINRNQHWVVKAIRKLKKAYRLCIEMNGGHFQHLKEFQ